MSQQLNGGVHRRRTARVALLSALAALVTTAALQAAEDERLPREEEAPEAPSEGGRPMTLLEFGVDADGTGAAGVFTSVLVPIGANDTIRAAYERTSFDDFEVLLSNGTIRTVDAKPATDIAVGYRHGFNRVGLSFGAERWGNEDQLQIDDLNIGVDFEAGRADWSLDLIDRSADVVFGTPGGPRETTVDGWGVSTGFGYLTTPVDFYMSLAWYDYGDELESDFIQAVLGNRSALSVSDSLIDRSALVGLRHQFEIWSFGMEAGWYRGAVTSSETTTLAAIFGLPISPRIDLQLTLGGASADFEDTTAYGVLSLQAALGGS
jgi:hypothetical protein